MHTPVEYFIKLPTALFRAGARTKPKFDYLRTMPPRDDTQVYDVKINPKTKMIDHKSGGLSLFTEPNLRFGPDWWVLPEDTPLPAGFTLTKDLTNGKFRGHYSIRSLEDIHVDIWKKTLLAWANEYAIHVSEYKDTVGEKNV
ncbi:hypothetical protein MSP8886_01350 [Marinomonas spartinae]|uniref:Tse2 ADP-ribosyltransferase toxin domain-containing protein n=1 Tax=Marinomonas spartinae TaxID=1792290 RepID=A0A1A8TAW3_9GAMM|nr:hypothetical protein [Marinomonas spartinae]SBS28892.1 hypothetical protein MSP8886_01350 [Marinomonas spartinae]